MASDIIYSVFVSSTYEDLREERAEVQKALLKLRCYPIGMEIFGSADEETWEVIQRQVREFDDYVVIIAGRYGSTDPDGVSFTEKEYDYARAIKKPVLAFIHGSRGSIPRNKTETDAEQSRKLEDFIKKVQQRSPVSYFTSPDQLAGQVIISYVNQRERTPAVGFIRADQVPDTKKYTELLEENARLKAALSAASEESKIEVSSDPNRGCLIRTPVVVYNNAGVIKETQGTSIRALVQATSRVAPLNVRAFLTQIERRAADGAWEESGHHENRALNVDRHERHADGYLEPIPKIRHRVPRESG